MASFSGSVVVLTLNIMIFMASTALSLSSLRVRSETVAAAAPAALPTTRPPSTELPPDVAPLLPSGGVVPSSGYSIPSIPSSPSEDPDEIAAFGPESAVAPSVPLPESSAMSLNVMIKSSETLLIRSLLACWLVLVY